MDNLKKNNVLSFGYEDTDKKIEIKLYGILFEIKNLDNIDELKEINENDINVIEAQLEKILGEGAIEKINNKRISDGYKKLDLNIELSILGCIFEAYAEVSVKNMLSKAENAVNRIDDNMNNFNVNREQRKNYNRNNYRRNKRNYRRY